MYPMINEGARILEEGIAARPSDDRRELPNAYATMMTPTIAAASPVRPFAGSTKDEKNAPAAIVIIAAR